jgi:hypothetical protein
MPRRASPTVAQERQFVGGRLARLASCCRREPGLTIPLAREERQKLDRGDSWQKTRRTPLWVSRYWGWLSRLLGPSIEVHHADRIRLQNPAA